MNIEMASRKNTRKATRKNTRKASRKASRKSTRKNTQAGGKRSEWTKKVMEVYRELKRKNPSARLGDAMREASRRYKH